MQLVLAAKEKSPTAADDYLKSHSLRPILNAFWGIRNSDPHEALAFDEMHMNDHGLGGKHLWPKTQAVIKEAGGSSAVNALAYLDMITCEYLQVYTVETLKSGWEAVEQYSVVIAEYLEYTNEDIDDDDDASKESFNCWKQHAHSHVYDNIEEKKWYQNQTNFKNVGPQILQNEFWALVASNIWNQIIMLAEAKDQEAKVQIAGSIENMLALDDEDGRSAKSFSNIYLGAPEKCATFGTVQERHAQDNAFMGFHTSFKHSINELLQQPDSPVKLEGNHKISINPSKDLVSLWSHVSVSEFYNCLCAI
ncbi:hypothetical protein DXG01_017229 [Tephrocybe rancida]|nr:hypothetical protein DXG01_017229 [Tephrocybe rancida]